MELPTALLQLKSCQILLVGTLLIIKGKEQALVVHAHEVCLTVEHGGCREIAVHLLLFLHGLLFAWQIRKSNRIVNRKRTLNINYILILHQRKIDKWAIEHLQVLVIWRSRCLFLNFWRFRLRIQILNIFKLFLKRHEWVRALEEGGTLRVLNLVFICLSFFRFFYLSLFNFLVLRSFSLFLWTRRFFSRVWFCRFRHFKCFNRLCFLFGLILIWLSFWWCYLRCRLSLLLFFFFDGWLILFLRLLLNLLLFALVGRIGSLWSVFSCVCRIARTISDIIPQLFKAFFDRLQFSFHNRLWVEERSREA